MLATETAKVASKAMGRGNNTHTRMNRPQEMDLRGTASGSRVGDALGGLGGATPTVLSERITLANTQAAGGSAPGTLQTRLTGTRGRLRPSTGERNETTRT